MHTVHVQLVLLYVLQLAILQLVQLLQVPAAEYVPFAQVEQAAAPSAEYCPAEHCVHEPLDNLYPQLHLLHMHPEL